MAFNLAPDIDAVGIIVSNNNFTNSPLNYPNYTRGYNAVYAGNRDVVSYDFNSGNQLAATNQLFEDSSYNSLFVVGNDNKYSNILVKDNLDSLPLGTGEAFVRYINAIPDSGIQPMVTLSFNRTNLFSGNAAFTTVSDFKGIAPGDLSVKVNSEGPLMQAEIVRLKEVKFILSYYQICLVLAILQRQYRLNIF